MEFNFTNVVAEAKTCLVAGCKIVVLVDSSNAMESQEFLYLKIWLKKFIASLRIEAVDK